MLSRFSAFLSDGAVRTRLWQAWKTKDIEEAALPIWSAAA